MEKKKVIKAIIKQVKSGDHLILTKTVKGQGAQEIPIYLANIQAPKMGSDQRTEEPFAFEAREYIRENGIGKKCEFTIEYSFGGRDYGILMLGDQNVGVYLVRQGLAKILERKGGQQTLSPYQEELQKAQEEAQKKQTGVWSSDSKYLQKHTRQVSYSSETGFNAQKIFEEAKAVGKPLESIVEYVFSASFLSVYIHKFQAQIKVSMVHLFTPSNDKEIQAQGKQFTEKFILNRTVGIELDRVEEGGNFVARIHHPAGDIAYEILKNGYSKLNAPKTMNFDAIYYKTLKEAQMVGQGKQAGLWKDFKQEEKKQQKATITDFQGKVIEVHSGDSLTIQRDSDFENIRVFLASVKAPLLMVKDRDPEPWAWESKETLRKLCIGKKVRVVVEFGRTVQAKEGGKDRNMDFASVFLSKNEKNLAVALLEKGLLRTNVSKSGDNASKFLEDLLGAEKKGSDQKQGIHSPHAAPLKVFNDLIANPKRAKDYEAIVMKRQNRKMNGVVEHCFSGMRYKVRLDQDNTAIALNLLGIKTMENDKNQPQMLEFANLALDYAKENLFQRDVIVELEFIDKRGSFFGTLWHKQKQDFAVDLVEVGFAKVNLVGTKHPPNLRQLEEAEQKAKSQHVGIWKEGLKLMQQQSPSKVKTMERVTAEMTDIQDANKFYLKFLNDNQYSKIESELKKFDANKADVLEKPIKKGTICAAKFSVDNCWYRAKVIGALGKGQQQVQFIDFGNLEIANGDELKQLPKSLLQYEPQAKECGLAFLKVPRIGKSFGQEAAKYVEKYGMGSQVDVIVAQQFGSKLQVVLFEKGEKDWNNSINAMLIAEGFAGMDSENYSDIPDEVNDWYQFEEEAKENQLNIWEYGGAGDDSD